MIKAQQNAAEAQEKTAQESANRPKTRSHTAKVTFNTEDDYEKDTIGAYWMTAERSECFDSSITTFVVEVPVKDHKLPEVVEAKKVEIKNLMDFDTFEEVEETGQEKVGSRWVITKKEIHDGQKTKCKARIVAKGFHEKEKPQSDSPTALRESVKIFLAVAANEAFELESVDIRAAFLQSKELDRDVFVEPPKDLKKENIVWKLKKPLYGLDDASRKFWAS